jgi:TRAP transporter TAXI family solute receptor
LHRRLFVFCLVLAGLAASHDAEAQDRNPKAFLGVAAGAAGASETVLAADLATLFPQTAELRLRLMLGDSGADNLALLLDDPDVDVAFVATDALAEAADKDKSLTGKFELVAKLPPQEIHLLARSDIAKLSDLSAKQVSVGPAGSASAATAASLFNALSIEVEAVQLDDAAAIERLKDGTLAAAIILGFKPSLQVAAIPVKTGIHLLPIPFGAPLEAGYLPTALSATDYPNLIRAGSEVPAIATGMLLLAAAKDQGARERVDRFVDTFFKGFADLQTQERHPKWREVNLAASLSGFKRTSGAEAWLAAKPEAKGTPVAASVPAAALPGGVLTSKEQQEALFRQFLEWQRGKER